MDTTKDVLTATDEHSIAGLPPHPLVITRAQGSYLWDKDGKRYLDLVSAYSAVNQGHCHARIVAAMIEQCQRAMLPGYHVYNESYALLCTKLCKLLNFEMAAAATSGAEAIDLAIRLARKWGYEKKGISQDLTLVLTTSHAYHGRSLGPLSSSDNALHREGCGPFLPGIGPDVAGNTIRFGNIGDVETAFKHKAATIAAFMIEPIEGYAGTIVPPEGYLKRVRELCTQHNILLITDEIQTGFGRTGYLMGYQSDDIEPDVVVLGKSLTGGAYSAGMVLSSKEVLGTFAPGQFGSTYSGNPLMSACAIAAIDVILEEKLVERCHSLGAQLEQLFAQIDYPCFAGVQGRGFFFSLSIREERPGVSAEAVVKTLMSKGILTAYSADRIRFAPPLSISEADLWWAVDEIESAFKRIAD